MFPSFFGSAVTVHDGQVTVSRDAALASPAMDSLARLAVFGDAEERDYARWLIWELGQATGVRPASVQELYMARGRGEVRGFTVPAINVRGMAYDTARSIFRTAVRMKAGAFLLEIARSEIAYTDQRPGEYVAVMLAAAMREGFRGPVFIQGDHFQVNAKKFAADARAEVDAVKALAREAIAAGFYNIDIDTSTLVDVSKPDLDAQQKLNYEIGIDILETVRDLEPDGVTISVGGEIGEVGSHNSTVEELRAYMEGLNRNLRRGMPGLSKISVQSGTSHGGVVASTLPDSAFNNFPKRETAEIHLATNFQNMLFDFLPPALRDEIYAWLRENAKDERKPTDSDEQFFYKTRKKALGPFKRRLWDLPDDAKSRLGKAYDQKFGFLFEQLAVGGTATAVARYVNAPVQHRPVPSEAEVAVAAAPDDADAGE